MRAFFFCAPRGLGQLAPSARSLAVAVLFGSGGATKRPARSLAVAVLFVCGLGTAPILSTGRLEQVLFPLRRALLPLGTEFVVSRRFQIAVAGGFAAGLVLVGSFGPLVRHEARRAAEAYGANVTVEQVVPTWLGVRLRGVDLTLAEVPAATIHLDEIEVTYTLARHVTLRGGLISAVGPREVVVQQAEDWRARHSARGNGGGSTGGGGGTEVVGLNVAWQNSAETPSESVAAKNVRVERNDATTRIEAEEATLVVGPASLSAKGGQVSLVRADNRYRVASLSASELDAELVLAAPEPAPAPAAAPDAATAAARPAPRKAAPPAAEPPDRSAEDALARANRALAARDLVLQGAAAIDALLEDGAKVDLAGVHAKVRRGDDTLNLGPGALVVHREGGRLLIELSPGALGAGKARENEQALTFKLNVPLRRAEGSEGEIVADVDGGPIWFSTLGIRDGDFGLLDVARTSLETRSHVVLSADGKKISVDGEGKIHGLSLRSNALSDEPVLGLELAWRGKGAADLDGTRLKVDDGEIDLGSIRAIARGEYERAGKAHRVRGDFEIPLAACQSMLDSVPKGLVPKLGGMRMAGSFAIKGRAKFDTSKLDRDFDLRWDVSNSCRVTEAPPEIQVGRFRRPFRRVAYTPEGEKVEIEVGPETPGWVSYDRISRFMHVAVMTTEDGGFERHHGFDEEAIKNSIRENLRSGKFVRGASTISMQLAKNVYLDRTKNLSRKLQEAVLTMYLEQELTKEQLMELYLNVIEFGPMVYGIGPAARHYFNASASELSLGQALYISSILPNPKMQHFGAGGEATPSWTSYLHKLMQIANKRRRITDEELEEGLRETVVRGSPAPHRSPADTSASLHGTGNADVQPPAEGNDWLGP